MQSQKDKMSIKQVTGAFLFYTRALDGNMLTALSELASEQSSLIEKTMKKCKQFVNYAASQEEAVLTCKLQGKRPGADGA